MSKGMYSFERFVKSRWSLVIIAHNRIIFRSQASAVKPLVRYLRERHPDGEPVVIYDKYVGRAAALLMVLIKPLKVYTPLLSLGGKEVFGEFGIPFQAQREVKYLMGFASDQMCQWEKLTAGKTPEEFWKLLHDI
ncbi:MAG: DUF1893 domain-containing protein [Candidatus Zixiibacteriota bacterium]|nr:MAG: DUF1893 domain-containing protein [candidate division Zixibacteria bacterium]